ncbi:COP1-interactive protein 1-like, partial [Salvia hispanica]|uniref:COP1-interactive protein 1-like n=1 Tax=Salvia hispanica TaxID=49212 RepID=UPI002009980E
SALLQKLEDQEKSSVAQVNDLKEQINNVRAEVSSLQEQLASLAALKSEADITLDIKAGEISELLLQIVNLKEEVSSKTAEGEKLLEEQKSLEERIATLSGIIQTYKEAQANVVGEISHKMNDTLTGIDAFNMKFEEDYGHIESRIHEIVNELKTTTNCIKDSNIEKDQLRKEIAILSQQLSDDKGNGVHLKGRMAELETALRKKEDEKDCLIKTVLEREMKMGELEKIVAERDEKIGDLEMKMKENGTGFDRLFEEKREAIRQLCICIEYHRSCNDELKDMIAKTRRR